MPRGLRLIRYDGRAPSAPRRNAPARLDRRVRRRPTQRKRTPGPTRQTASDGLRSSSGTQSIPSETGQIPLETRQIRFETRQIPGEARSIRPARPEPPRSRAHSHSARARMGLPGREGGAGPAPEWAGCRRPRTARSEPVPSMPAMPAMPSTPPMPPRQWPVPASLAARLPAGPRPERPPEPPRPGAAWADCQLPPAPAAAGWERGRSGRPGQWIPLAGLSPRALPRCPVRAGAGPLRATRRPAVATRRPDCAARASWTAGRRMRSFVQRPIRQGSIAIHPMGVG